MNHYHETIQLALVLLIGVPISKIRSRSLQREART